MNNNRREHITRAMEQLAIIEDDLRILYEAEEEARDNIPESMQDGERYAIADAACENIDSAIEAVSEAIDALEEARA